MDAAAPQRNILKPLPALARALTFALRPQADPRAALERLRLLHEPPSGIVGFGEPLVRALGSAVDGLRTFPALSGAGVAVHSTQHALWVQLHGDDRGMLFDREIAVLAALDDAFFLDDAIDLFRYRVSAERIGRDLSGYEDGTENPKAEAATAAAIAVGGSGRGGSSFVAVQRWVHDLARFRRFKPKERDDMMGRNLESNEELDDAPESAHVKRAAQESYDPEAFMVRRSMPWAKAHTQGLEFVAYGESLDRYERVLHRMLGLDDGIVDGLFTFSRPVSGSYYWCPPVARERLDLRLLGL
ncbi:MAG TPA: Dyp-type peroxidase [Casimicrobiaceae bacterium]|nr:Dyp-type peroxidase [Casimicrobiaceae bacterium]